MFRTFRLWGSEFTQNIRFTKVLGLKVEGGREYSLEALVTETLPSNDKVPEVPFEKENFISLHYPGQ